MSDESKPVSVSYSSDRQYPEHTSTCTVCGAAIKLGEKCESCGEPARTPSKEITNEGAVSIPHSGIGGSSVEPSNHGNSPVPLSKPICDTCGEYEYECSCKYAECLCDEMCACGHKRGVHWLRGAMGSYECSEDGCTFAPSTLKEVLGICGNLADDNYLSHRLRGHEQKPTCINWKPVAPPEKREDGWISVPNEPGWWWHIMSDSDVSAPFMYSILTSGHGHNKRLFIAYPDSRWVEDVGGLWARAVPPPAPPEAK